MTLPTDATLKQMKLRYAGTCQTCRTQLPAGTRAVYDRAAKCVTCLDCTDHVLTVPNTDLAAESIATRDATTTEQLRTTAVEVTAIEPEVETGRAGASARREHERRKTKREARIREAPRVLAGSCLP